MGLIWVLKLLAHTPQSFICSFMIKVSFIAAQIHTYIIRDLIKHGHHLWSHSLEITPSGFPEPLKIDWVLAKIPNIEGEKKATI